MPLLLVCVYKRRLSCASASVSPGTNTHFSLQIKALASRHVEVACPCCILLEMVTCLGSCEHSVITYKLCIAQLSRFSKIQTDKAVHSWNMSYMAAPPPLIFGLSGMQWTICNPEFSGVGILPEGMSLLCSGLPLSLGGAKCGCLTGIDFRRPWKCPASGSMDHSMSRCWHYVCSFDPMVSWLSRLLDTQLGIDNF